MSPLLLLFCDELRDCVIVCLCVCVCVRVSCFFSFKKIDFGWSISTHPPQQGSDEFRYGLVENFEFCLRCCEFVKAPCHVLDKDILYRNLN